METMIVACDKNIEVMIKETKTFNEDGRVEVKKYTMPVVCWYADDSRVEPMVYEKGRMYCETLEVFLEHDWERDGRVKREIIK